MRGKVKQREDKAAKLQKSDERELKKAATLHKKVEADKARIAREKERERKQKEKEAKVEKLAAARAQKQQERDAATT